MEEAAVITKVLIKDQISNEVTEVFDECSCRFAGTSSHVMENCTEEGGSVAVFSVDSETFKLAVKLFRDWNPRKRAIVTEMVEVVAMPRRGGPAATQAVEAIVLDHDEDPDKESSMETIAYMPNLDDLTLLNFLEAYKFTNNPVDGMWQKALPPLIYGTEQKGRMTTLVDTAIDIVVLAGQFRNSVLEQTWRTSLSLLRACLSPEPSSFSTVLLLSEEQVEKMLDLFHDGSLPIPPRLSLSQEDVPRDLFARLYVSEMAGLVSGCMIGSVHMSGGFFEDIPFKVFLPDSSQDWAYYSTGLYNAPGDNLTREATLEREKVGWTLRSKTWDEGGDPEEDTPHIQVLSVAIGTGSLPFPPIHGWQRSSSCSADYALQSYGIYDRSEY
jgi:hypothetical protein